MISDQLEQAIHAWVTATSELAAGLVRWKRQTNGGQPDGCFIAMEVVEAREVGPGWLQAAPAPTPVPGADLTFTQVGPMRAVLSLDCFLGNGKWNAERPDRRLANVIRSRLLPLRGQALRAAGLGFGAAEPIQLFDLSRTMVHESRARARIAIHYIARASELGTSIARVEAVATIDGRAKPFVAP